MDDGNKVRLCLLCGKTRDRHNMSTGIPVCPDSAVPVFRSDDEITLLRKEIARKDAALSDALSRQYGAIHTDGSRSGGQKPSKNGSHPRKQAMTDTPKTTLTDGRQVYPEHRNKITEGTRKGQQQDYVVLSEEERAKGFIRPVRQSYKHLKCGVVTTMGLSLAETFARDPNFYNGTFCCGCQDHFPVGEDGEFVWDGTEERVGT